MGLLLKHKHQTRLFIQREVEQRIIDDEEMTYMEAITQVVTEFDIDLNDVSELIPEKIKQKLFSEVTEKRLIPISYQQLW